MVLSTRRGFKRLRNRLRPLARRASCQSRRMRGGRALVAAAGGGDCRGRGVFGCACAVAAAAGAGLTLSGKSWKARVGGTLIDGKTFENS
ncbi:Hypothetical predicted protein [Podarcis lilfordi]|uniref:Uncharacterized protein n=1 Tax=Podarcis lilfordi TaxID=74358 RepID=A0AA35JXW1_9SAUR|nr:Hypothetical predicted protein [Podarcis lilfordi]